VNTSDSTAPTIPNGSGAAAMLAAAIGSFVLALIAFAGDKSVRIKNSLNFYKPTWRWGKRNVAMSRINRVSLALLVLSILLTFPPIVDLL